MFQELHKLLKPMDLPDHRKSTNTLPNLRWLSSNLKVRNETHKNYQPAIELVDKLIKSQARK